MINWDDLKNLDVKNFDLTKLDVRNVEFPKLGLPELPEFDLPVEADRLVGFARDAAYASVGVVVVGMRKADGRRRELTDQVTAQVRKLVDTVA